MEFQSEIDNRQSKIMIVLMSETTVTGYILAGGQSRRMGRDKAWMNVCGQPMITLLIDQLRGCAERVCVITHPDKKRDYDHLDTDACLTDLVPDRGPMMGIYSGLMHTTTPLNLFIACDMPWISKALFKRLFAAWKKEVMIVASLGPAAARYPLPMLCHLSAARTVGALMDRGRFSLQELLRQPQARLVNLNEPQWMHAFMNVNTLSDYAAVSS